MRYRVVGPPGTGKTQFLLDRVNDYLAKGIPPDRIAFCSFTTNAANEAKNRAIAKFPYPASSFRYFRTEHSICFRLLAEKIGLSRHNIFTGKRKKEFADTFHYDLTIDENELSSRFNEAMLSTISDYYEFFVAWRSNMMLPFDEAYRLFARTNLLPNNWSEDGLRSYIANRTKFKAEKSLWDFNDLIYACLKENLYPDVDVILVDEAQDCGKLLFNYIENWSERAKDTFISGDYLQTLYSWAGASPELFLSFPIDEEIVLRQSYRLPAAIKDYAVELVKRLGLPIPDFKPKDEEGSVEFGDLNFDSYTSFLLCRTRFQVSKFYDLLIDYGIPFYSERVKQNPIFTTKGKAFLAIKKVKDGDTINLAEIEAICRHTGKPFLETGTKTRVKQYLDGDYSRFHLRGLGFTEEFFSHDVDDIMFREIDNTEKVYLTRVYNKYGRGGFEKSLITLTTQHGAKGSERELVVISPDLTRRIFENFVFGDERDETLLAYTSVTRAMKKVIILPSTQYSFPYPHLRRRNESFN
jgi:DNA helicase-2/ATP-dependent DNA helicase PcrA